MSHSDCINNVSSSDSSSSDDGDSSHCDMEDSAYVDRSGYLCNGDASTEISEEAHTTSSTKEGDNNDRNSMYLGNEWMWNSCEKHNIEDSIPGHEEYDRYNGKLLDKGTSHCSLDINVPIYLLRRLCNFFGILLRISLEPSGACPSTRKHTKAKFDRGVRETVRFVSTKIFEMFSVRYWRYMKTYSYCNNNNDKLTYRMIKHFVKVSKTHGIIGDQEKGLNQKVILDSISL